MARRHLLIAAALAAFGAPAAGQETPPSGEWLGAGVYCARGVQAAIPDGYEAISFGAGVEIRRADEGGRTFAELESFPDGAGMPDFEQFADLMVLTCRDGFELEARDESRDAPGLDSLGVLTRRCVGPSGSYGVLFARAELTVDGGPHDASVIVLFGDAPFQVGRASFDQESLVPESDAAALFDTLTSGLAACPIEEPPAPPPPPRPTGWLGGGDHCAFTMGATVPDGLELRLNGLASNGGVIDVRRAGVDESDYHRSRILVWPLRGEALEPPEPSMTSNDCIDGFEHRRIDGTIAGHEPSYVMMEGCFADDGQYYGAIEARRVVSLPGGAHQLRGEFIIGSDGLPPRLAWTERLFLTEAEVRAVVDVFMASMTACES